MASASHNPAANVKLAIDNVPPAVAVNSLVTKSNKPTLTGTVTGPVKCRERPGGLLKSYCRDAE